MRKNSYAFCGGAFGDEGKGKIVYEYAKSTQNPAPYVTPSAEKSPCRLMWNSSQIKPCQFVVNASKTVIAGTTPRRSNVRFVITRVGAL